MSKRAVIYTTLAERAPAVVSLGAPFDPAPKVLPPTYVCMPRLVRGNNPAHPAHGGAKAGLAVGVTDRVDAS